MTDSSAAFARPTLRIAIATGVLPLAVGVAAALLMLSWRSNLPAEIAVHWGVDGATRTEPVTVTAVVVLAFSALFAGIGLGYGLAKSAGPTLVRVVGAASTGVTAFFAAVMTGIAAEQRGVTQPMAAEFPVGAVLGAGAVAVVAAVVAAVVVPRWEVPPAPTSDDAPVMRLSPSELVSWTRPVAASPLALTVIVFAVAVTALAAYLSGTWWVLLVGGAPMLIVLAMYAMQVKVDQHGVTVRAVLGVPRWTIPLDDISHADVGPVRPMRDFGGWGYRVGALGRYKGATGLVLRGGEAIVVHRHDGRRFVVVVDDAATAAGLVNGLLARAR